MKTIVRITGMHCSSCALSIDDGLEELVGVKRAKTSYAKQQSEVEFDPEVVTEAALIAAVQAAGYQAVLRPTEARGR